MLRWVNEGYRLEWDSDGPATERHARNLKSALDNEVFVDEQIVELLASGAIGQTHRRPKVVNPLGVVPKSNGKLRLILDMRRVSGCLIRRRFGWIV